jgi:hypothetical protein
LTAADIHEDFFAQLKQKIAEIAAEKHPSVAIIFTTRTAYFRALFVRVSQQEANYSKALRVMQVYFCVDQK